MVTLWIRKEGTYTANDSTLFRNALKGFLLKIDTGENLHFKFEPQNIC